MTGWLRLERFHVMSDRLCAAGVFTGELVDSNGTTIGVGSRRRTVPAEIARSLHDRAVVIGPVDVDLLGLTVSIPAFTMGTGVVRRPLLCNLAGGLNKHQPGAAPAPAPALVAPAPTPATAPPPGLVPAIAPVVAPGACRRPEAAPSRFSFLKRTTTMTSLACIPSPAAAVDPPAVDPPAVPTRHERPALTESMFVRLAGCHTVRERRALQQEVVLLNLFLADRIAARYAGRGVDWDDLVQVARLGLIKAVVGYQAGKGAGFAAYAGPTIAGEIKRHFRDHGWMIRPPRRLQELQGQLRSVEPALQQRLHRKPSVVELASELDVEAGELSDAQVAAQGYTLDSLDVPAHFGSSVSRGDGMPDQDDPYSDVERAEWLRPALARLTDREQRIIRMRFVDGLTQAQVGARLGVSQMQASRLLKAILGRLRDHLVIDNEAATA